MVSAFALSTVTSLEIELDRDTLHWFRRCVPNYAYFRSDRILLFRPTLQILAHRYCGLDKEQTIDHLQILIFYL